MIARYRKRPVVISAVQWVGSNAEEVKTFLAESELLVSGKIFMISTLEGPLVCSLNDYVIKGTQGEFYPCKPDIFEEIYEKVI